MGVWRPRVVLTQLVKSLTKPFDQISLSKFRSPFFRNTIFTIVSTSQLPVDRTGGVGIVTKVDSEQTPFPERITVVECPQSSLKSSGNMTGAYYFRRFTDLE